jgi:hypothetical protein
MAQRLAYGDSADLKFGCDRVLPQLLAFAQLAAENLFSEPF